MAKGTPKTRPGFNATLNKKPRVRATPDYYQTPSWRFSLLDLQPPYGWHEIDREKLIEIRDKLSDFESMTWHEILVGAADRNHAIIKDKLCEAVRKRLKAINQDDVDHLISLRLSGEERVFGILEVGVFRLLFWDPEHEICPSKIKNT